MWKDYSSGFIKNNKASSLSIMAAALIATLFLSFLCTLFYNFWMDETARIKGWGWRKMRSVIIRCFCPSI